MKFNPYDDPFFSEIKTEKTDYKVEHPRNPEALHSKEDLLKEETRKKREKREPPDSAGAHIRELTKAAEKAHEYFSAHHIPYRFCIYEEGKDVFIDIVRLDAGGKPEKTVKKNITREDFWKWMDILENHDGMILDESM